MLHDANVKSFVNVIGILCVQSSYEQIEKIVLQLRHSYLPNYVGVCVTSENGVFFLNDPCL